MNTMTNSQVIYLKAIYDLSFEKKITVTMISKYLKLSKPSVVNALKKLQSEGYITYNDSILLTTKGIRYSKNIKRREVILKKFFTEVLKVDKTTAKSDINAIFSSISCCTINKLEDYIASIMNVKKTKKDEYCILSECNCKECSK